MNMAWDSSLWPVRAGVKEAVEKFWPTYGAQLGASQRELVWSSGQTQLFKYYDTNLHRAKNLPARCPILVLPSLINRSYVLDLLPQKSFIANLVAEHGCVYILEWGTPRDEDQFLTFDSLIRYRLKEAIAYIQMSESYESIHLMGHCLGGTVAAIAAALWPQSIQSLTMLTAPIDFSTAGKLSLWARNSEFNVENFVQAYGRMPWALMQTSFQLLKPMLMYQKAKKLMTHWKNTEYMHNFMALEFWSMDNVDFYGRCYQTLIENFYRRNEIVTGDFRIGSEKIYLQSIKAPVLNFFVEDDHIVPTNSVLNSFHLDPATSMTLLSSRGGHVGGLIGQRSQKNIWPQINEWIRKVELL